VVGIGCRRGRFLFQTPLRISDFGLLSGFGLRISDLQKVSQTSREKEPSPPSDGSSDERGNRRQSFRGSDAGRVSIYQYRARLFQHAQAFRTGISPGRYLRERLFLGWRYWVKVHGDGYARLETILDGRTEMNAAIKTAQCCFLRSGGEVGKTAPERKLQGANLIRSAPRNPNLRFAAFRVSGRRADPRGRRSPRSRR